ncbi:uncharacterized protein BDW70DRAFT_144887 [Aspergillus foveolatus]|uniref:uncharacterized protein n=1 Tax=Aspergillus foveolatus TaxID=210207 RepID=UPI003CCCAAA2
MHADEMLHQAETLPQSNASTPSNRESLGGTQLPLTWMMNPILPRLHGRSSITGIRTQSRSKPVSVPDSLGNFHRIGCSAFGSGVHPLTNSCKITNPVVNHPSRRVSMVLLDWRYIPAHTYLRCLEFLINATAKAYPLDNSSFSSCLSHLLVMSAR